MIRRVISISLFSSLALYLPGAASAAVDFEKFEARSQSGDLTWMNSLSPVQIAEALSLCASFGKEACVKGLLSKGVDVDLPYAQTTPLLIALERKEPTMARLLIEAGADEELADSRGRTPVIRAAKSIENLPILRYLLDRGRNPNTADANGMSPLHYACDSENEPAIRLLLEKGAMVNSLDRQGRTPLRILLEKGFWKNRGAAFAILRTALKRMNYPF